MSKLEAQRAMRAARYDAAHAGTSPRAASATTAAKAPGAAKAPRASKARAAAPATARPADTAADAPVTELCGHRSSIGGKSCKRPAGHSETTHRYS
ncbi:hypothetical protein [Pengzhenrongella sicca]|uniref:Uncharacterized protein n=1 Tax=Pengzhenrongella sicca TaxID=2819238 RepID=A0A8A4ZFP4_9MICO|nr:hypothetical protein [Pengzhenrongella sicca]QTE29753.1 hypothetical protein J4E96_01520 [Pengzhenrongella sicca]